MSVKGDEKTGTVFFSKFSVNIAEVLVIRSGRMPITFMVQVPAGFNEDTYITPVVESTLMRSVSATSECPSELSTPVYIHVVAYVPQFRVAENAVIGRL